MCAPKYQKHVYKYPEQSARTSIYAAHNVNATKKCIYPNFESS